MLRAVGSSAIRLTPRALLGLLVVAASYFAAGTLGLGLASSHGSVTLVWAPTGIAIAALLLGGLRLWPGVLVVTVPWW